MLDHNKYKMVFITAGMGGAQVQGAAPQLQLAKREILTVGIVTPSL
jgi:cell division GTPase FtsZ